MRHAFPGSCSRTALALFAALALPPAVRAETPDEAASVNMADGTPDPLFSLGGSRIAWSVSKSEIGCLLVSPAHKGGIRMALGRHAAHGTGLLLIGLAVAVGDPPKDEPVALAAGGRTLAEGGREVARKVLFVPLSAGDLAIAMREVQNAGTLWVTVLRTSIADGGDGAKEAVDAYISQCASPEHAATLQ